MLAGPQLYRERTCNSLNAFRSYGVRHIDAAGYIVLSAVPLNQRDIASRPRVDNDVRRACELKSR